MGMFDSLRVKLPLPLNDELKSLSINWEDEEFQTKDLDNLLDQYEISKEGKLLHLLEQCQWVKAPSALFGGYMEPVSQEWVAEPFHGVIRFCTTYCDYPHKQWRHGQDSQQMNWKDIVETEGYDWWIEFAATFDQGSLRDIQIAEVSKSLIRSRLCSHKESSEKREAEQNTILGRLSRTLGKSKVMRKCLRQLYSCEQRCHERVSRLLLRLGRS